MSFREFGFQKDDEEFFQDVFDSSQRHLQLARYSGARWTNTVIFYVMTLFLGIYVVLHLVFEDGGFLVSAILALFFAMISMSTAMSADGKYKMAKIVDELAQQRSKGSDDRQHNGNRGRTKPSA